MARISVGVPVYNGANYLQAALASLLSQSFEDLEIIIADNASTDSTEQIAREAAAADSRVSYHRHADNIGAAANFNFTLEQSSSDYFMWSPHDDIRHPLFVERALAAFNENPAAASVFSRAASIDSEGKQRRVMQRPDDLLSSDVAKRMRATITSRHPGVIIFGLIRTSLLRRVGGQRTFPGGDRVLAADLAINGPFVELPEVMFFNRDHPERYVQLKRSHGAAGRLLQEGWWVPHRAHRITFPGWSQLGGYLQAIRQAPLTSGERMRCYAALLAAATDQGGAIPRSLAGDLVTALVTATGKVAKRRVI